MAIRGRRDTEIVDRLHYASITCSSHETVLKVTRASSISVCMSDFTLHLLQNQECN